MGIIRSPEIGFQVLLDVEKHAWVYLFENGILRKVIVWGKADDFAGVLVLVDFIRQHGVIQKPAGGNCGINPTALSLVGIEAVAVCDIAGHKKTLSFIDRYCILGENAEKYENIVLYEEYFFEVCIR